jgi:DNA polymerase (family X)
MDSEADRPNRRQLVGGALWRLGDLTSIDEPRSFRARAYRRGVWALDDLSPGLEETAEEMQAVRGIGAGLIRLIEEMRQMGTIAALELLERRYPAESNRLAQLPRMTAKQLRLLKEMGIDTAAQLRDAIDSAAVESLSGIGPSTAEYWDRIMAGWPDEVSVPLFRADQLAEVFAAHLRRLLGATVAVGGEVRRREEWVGMIELAMAGDEPAALLSAASASAAVTGHSRWAADIVTLGTHAGIPLRIIAGPPRRAGWSLIRATGPDAHVAALEQRIATTEVASEEEAYRRAGLEVVPPPARGAEIRPTRWLTAGAIIADFHIHTTWSPDGHQEIEEVVQDAARRGYRCIAITDHAEGLRLGALSADALAEQRGALGQIEVPEGLVVLHGAELNIGRDGSLDYDDYVLAWLDFCVAAVHSNFGLDRDEQTARLIRAIEHPSVRVIAHPTTRRVGLRPPIDVDFDEILTAAARTGTALEVNGHIDRLDLSAELARRAHDAGVLLVADSDAHRPDEMDNVANAVAMLQRAGVPPEGVVNAWDPDRLLDWAITTRPEPPD